MFIDIETNELITKKQLYKEYTKNREKYPEEYNYSFMFYIRNSLTMHNGTLETIKTEDTDTYYVIDYYTEDIIDVLNDINKAISICKNTIGTQVITENDDVIYTNIDIPF